MKRFFTLVLALCLLASTALAETTLNIMDQYYTVDDLQEQISKVWQQTYETPWRTVEIDVQATAPQVQSMPILKVTPAFWIPETSSKVEWISRAGHDDPDSDTFSLSCGEIYKEEQMDNVMPQTEYYYAPLDAQQSYAPQNPLTIRNMLTLLDEILSDIDNLHCGLDADHIFSVNVTSHRNKKTHEVVLPARMTLTLATTLRAIPLWGHVIMSVDTRKDNELFYDPKVFFTMRSSSSYDLMGSTVKENEVISADIPLCSFDKIISALEEEIMAGHIRHIYCVDLGFALYNEPGVTRQSGREWIRTAEFYAVPTWRCTCIYTNLAKQELPDETVENPEPSMYYKTLYINAQTGELFSPIDDRSGCADYQGFISWEEVK